MPTASSLTDLLLHWEELRQQGQTITPEELCRQCPEHLDELRRRIGALAAVNQGMALTVEGQETASLNAAGPDAWQTLGPEAGNMDAGLLRIPGYEILAELGRGGMGVVYKARQIGLNRLVAIKMILSGSLAGESEIARFKNEAEAVAKLQHPNIVQIYEIGEYQGHPYFSLEYVDGGSLDRKLQGTPQPPEEAARLVETLARAVQAAHDRGIVHRDLKPANVLLQESGIRNQGSGSKNPLTDSCLLTPDSCIPKLTDFGLAKRLDADSGQTKTGAVMGTPSYMAPEQARGDKEIGPAADVYALGAILYECLTGRPPFKASSSWETVRLVIEQEPVSVTQLQPKTPRDLETICQKCLQKEARKRYGSALALAEDLRRYRSHEPILARPVGKLERALRWCKRNPIAAALVISLLVGLGTALGLAIWAMGERDRADAEAGNAQTNESIAKTNETLAKKNETLAKKNEDLAARADETLAAFEQVQIANGLREANEGHLYQALRWFALPLRGDGANKPRAEMYRYRLSDYWRLPQDVDRTGYILSHVLQPQESVHCTYAGFSPDGRRVVTVNGITARVWAAATGQPASPPLQHQGFVSHAAFSPDGRRVVTAGNTTARVWDAATGQPAGPPLQHPRRMGRAVFSPDGRRLLTTGEDKTAWVWDAATGQPAGPPLSHQARVTHAAFSPDGQRVVSSSEDKTARVWDAATGQPTGPPLQHQDFVSHAAFSHDGRQVVTSSNKTAQVWDAATGQPTGPPLQHEVFVSQASFSPDGRQVVTTSSNKTARVWDAATGQPVGLPLQHQDFVSHAAFSPDGRRVVTASNDGTAQVWYPGGGRAGPPLPHQSAVGHAAFSPDGRRVVTASRDGSARVWDAVSGQPASPPLQHQGVLVHAAISPDGRRVVTAGWNPPAQVWDAATGQPVGPPLQHRNHVAHVAFSPDGRHVITASWDATARVWDAATGQPAGQPLQHKHNVSHAAFSPDGQRVVTSSWDGTARVWDAATGQPVGPPLKQGREGHAVFSPDGRRVLTASAVKAQVWDAATGQPVGPPLQHVKNVTHVTFSPDGRRIVTASEDKTARVWDAITSQPVGPPINHRGRVVHAAFSPDGQHVLTASDDRTARVWDAATGQPVGLPLEHYSVSHAVFSPDGRRVVTATGAAARVWDAASGQPVGPWLQHRGSVVHAGFSPDGRRMVTASGDNDRTVRLWDVSLDARPAEDWVRLTRFLAGDTDRFGALCTPEQMRQDWNYLRTKYPQDFTVTPAQALAWHRREAAACVKEKNPAAALFHTLHACDSAWAVPWGMPRW
jgi:WD40 repeat protein/serine/threonine protein kinase